MLLHFVQWLASTNGSITIHEDLWAYPLIESVHVLGLCLFLGLAIALDLRLLGLTLRDVPASQVVERLMPWTMGGFALMFGSGALLVYAIPVRAYQSIFFRAKVVMLILAGLNAWIFHRTIYRSVADWNLDAVPPRQARRAAAFSLALWAGIVIAGRMIAYNWFDCDRGPAAIVRVLAGCVANSP